MSLICPSDWSKANAKAELRSLTNGLPSRTNVCTQRKRTCGPQAHPLVNRLNLA